ncbi:MAG: ACT domain-containing protein, partial [Blastocatellia bacterium]
MPTASAVVGDIINLASALRLPDFAPYFEPKIASNKGTLLPAGDTESPFYIRLESNDTPGVIGNLGHAFGEHGVSLHSLLQRGRTGNGSATIVLLTHRARTSDVLNAIKDIGAQATTKQIGVVIRVFE